ncbi:hypothetical protein FT663_04271 [Candidozyma haemuli var. vulneris]|uniref:RRM domain-containing protein n=1 Tax=Candidozyma haemuli TaxID=45357 RepID=A0A2V1AND0_9ASCO|nr:hypothetical protein CXQ85_003635 [[Candida] haemuloni]KAF3986769.1 hypothetical protein FT662_04379 [[Candida] haemuloni var. vulneris]KAF3987878.1 hypothetical protein FT663_04271 [[Candida] haemuloni var. vulneris]PVH19777.1 hypothetical protein CXQ85_003635 [[Candida] haemuloni]
MGEEKVSKKKQKALLFRKSKDEREQEQAVKAEKKEQKVKKEEEESVKRKAEEDEPEQPKKKRKTRRGKKGKGVNDGKGPRFLLFVGNLPYDIQQAELVAHFKNANPDRIRIRKEKGIAFLEFDNDNSEIQSKMELALRMHKSTLRNRKINVELTVGGGGNSEARQQKLKDKNDKLEEQRRERIKKQAEAARAEKKDDDAEKPTTGQPSMHPARAALLK